MTHHEYAFAKVWILVKIKRALNYWNFCCLCIYTCTIRRV